MLSNIHVTIVMAGIRSLFDTNWLCATAAYSVDVVDVVIYVVCVVCVVYAVTIYYVL